MATLKFFRQLSDDIHMLVGLAPGEDAGFMDVAALRGGEKWSEELLTALGTCPVFVPLVSPRYVLSEWCAREWHTFARRAATAKPPGRTSTPVLPVLWADLPDTQIPAPLKRLQFFQPSEPGQPELTELYWRNGLYGLAVARHESYRTIVWKIAQRIAQIYESHYVEHTFVTNHEELPSSFEADR